MDRATARAAMERVLSGQLTPVQVAGLAVALRAKGGTADEITGMAEGMISQPTPVELDRDTVDIVGTGGDRVNTVNVSTMAALVAAGAGAKVVKHGNRAASSACGAADCLEALGVGVDIDPKRHAAVLEEIGLAFLFAPWYHASLRYAAPARKELGIQTTSNLLGPLTNPARPYAAAIGIADGVMAPLVADALAARGTRGLVFHGENGLDELTTTMTPRYGLLHTALSSRPRLIRPRSGLPQPRQPTLSEGIPRSTLVWCARCWRGSMARCVTSCCLTPLRPCWHMTARRSMMTSFHSSPKGWSVPLNRLIPAPHRTVSTAGLLLLEADH